MAVVVKQGYKFSGFVTSKDGKRSRKLFVGGETIPTESLPKGWEKNFKDAFIVEASAKEAPAKTGNK